MSYLTIKTLTRSVDDTVKFGVPVNDLVSLPPLFHDNFSYTDQDAVFFAEKNKAVLSTALSTVHFLYLFHVVYGFDYDYSVEEMLDCQPELEISYSMD